MRKLQEILSTTTQPLAIDTEILATVVNATRANLIGTNLLAMRLGPGDIKDSTITIPLQTRNSIAVSKVSEGAEIPIDTEAVTSFTMSPVKYATRPYITREMIEDAKWAVVERNLAESGYQMGRRLDSLIMTAIEGGSSDASNNITGGAAITANNIVTAITDLEGQDYVATDMVLHPNVAGDIRLIDTFVEADKAGVTNPSQNLIGQIYGARVWVSTQVTSNYAYVLDKNHALVLAEKRPITVERYEDAVRDMSGIAISARWHARHLRNDANVVITTT